MGLFFGGLILLLVIGPAILGLFSYLMKFLSPVLMYMGLVAVSVMEGVLIVWVIVLLTRQGAWVVQRALSKTGSGSSKWGCSPEACSCS